MGINTSHKINSWDTRRRHSCGISGLQQTLRTPHLRITWRQGEGYGVGAFKNAGPPRWLSSKESAYDAEDAGDPGLIPGSRLSPGGGHGNPLQYSCLENPHGQRSLVGFSPWGRKDLDTTERLSTAQFLYYSTLLGKTVTMDKIYFRIS